MKLTTQKQFKGFTLIELLVVIAIIAILASIILASLNQARVKSRDARRVADVKEIQNALEIYNNDQGYYPADMYAATGGLAPTYIATMPTDPQGGGDYLYAPLSLTSNSTSCNSYHLGTTMEQTTNNTTLNSKAGMTASANVTTANSRGYYLCGAVGATADFDGSATAVYDVSP